MGCLVVVDDGRGCDSKSVPVPVPVQCLSENIHQSEYRTEEQYCLQDDLMVEEVEVETYHKPLFTIGMTLIQLIAFISTYHQYTTPNDTDPDTLLESPFIFCSLSKCQVWKFMTYMFVHSSWIHLLFNLFVQLMVGVPLEFAHGPARTGLIYLTGVLAGSLSVSVFAPNVCLIGASSGIYALLAAHLSHVILNYKQVQFVCVRIVGIILIAVVGNCNAGSGQHGVSRSSSASPTSTPWFLDDPVKLPVSELAHFAGAFAGLTMGLVVLKRSRDTAALWSRLLRWFAFGLNGGFLATLIVFTCLGSKY